MRKNNSYQVWKDQAKHTGTLARNTSLRTENALLSYSKGSEDEVKERGV